MKQEKRRVQYFLCLCLFMLMLGANKADLAEKCNLEVEKVTPCLGFTTGKVAAPPKDCCDSTEKIKESAPECLCYIIEQVHKGSPEIKSLGIQGPKLLQLPTACNLKNISITRCPKLLGLSPSSPDAAIFTNASSGIAITTTTNSQNQNSSYGSMLRPPLMADLMVVDLAILLFVIPITGFVSIYS